MPIYEYQCETCGVVTDIKHGFKETTDASCPKCGGARRRVFNPAGIGFKGSGFYVTDSRKGSDSSGGETAAKADPAPKTDSGPKSDTAA